MSLDVYLISETKIPKPQSSGIFVRDNGVMKEISLEEWLEKNPGRVPVTFKDDEELTDEMFHGNITHNLNRMAEAAGIYDALWRPDEIGRNKAGELIGMLSEGYRKLKTDPEEFKKLNPENGWGDYEGLLNLVEKYLLACITYPDATVTVSR